MEGGTLEGREKEGQEEEVEGGRRKDRREKYMSA